MVRNVCQHKKCMSIQLFNLSFERIDTWPVTLVPAGSGCLCTNILKLYLDSDHIISRFQRKCTIEINKIHSLSCLLLKQPAVQPIKSNAVGQSRTRSIELPTCGPGITGCNLRNNSRILAGLVYYTFGLNWIWPEICGLSHTHAIGEMLNP